MKRLRRARRALAAWAPVATVVVVVAAVLAGCGSTGPAIVVPPGEQTSTIHWGACQDSNLPSGYQCATLAVPIDGEEAGDSGPTFPLALDRHAATGTRIGSLLVNPGGPGVSGVDALPGLVEGMFSSSLQAHFDIIGFDPPGVGASDAVTCLGTAAYGRYLHLDPAPVTATGIATLVAGNRVFAQGCRARSATILPHVSTVAAARDMDRIRRAVGDPKLTYLGFSYGTLLGATYAELYPTRVRAMVLDGAIDPSLAPVPMIVTQSEALDGQLRQLEASCAASSSCAWKPAGGQRLALAFQALLARVRAHPVVVSGSGHTVGPAELLYGTAAGLYSTSTWPSVEQALASLGRGDGGQMLSLYDNYVGQQSDGTYANTFEAETAVDCLDAPAPSIAQLTREGRSLVRLAPAFGLLDLYSEITCALWPVKATSSPHRIAAAGAPPIVVVGSTGDPITPYIWAVSLAHQLRQGVLLTRVGDGHTGYGSSSCVRTAVDHYLAGLITPPGGERCASN